MDKIFWSHKDSLFNNTFPSFPNEHFTGKNTHPWHGKLHWFFFKLYRNWFVTQYITYLNIREALSGTLSHCQPMTDWFWFEILVGADLLPSTGFKINFLAADQLLKEFQIKISQSWVDNGTMSLKALPVFSSKWCIVLQTDSYNQEPKFAVYN